MLIICKPEYFNGKILNLTQEPYLTGTHEEPHYEAHGKDIQGKDVIVRWDITHPDFENLEDESEACEWDQPKEVETI